MRLPHEVAAAVEEIAEGGVSAARRVGGGDINEAAAVDVGGRTVFVKWHRNAPADFFAVEADGLRRLGATRTVRVPNVLGVSETPAMSVLVMELIDAGPPTAAAMADAGRNLARLHARRSGAPGLERNNVIGSLPQDNRPVGDGVSWVAFFRERRLLALADDLPPRVRRGLERLPLQRLLTEPVGGCALLHGDLWGGNLVCTRGGAGVFVDPAVYRGHPEVDLAMTRLFGGFSEAFYDAYQQVAGPFDNGLDARLAVLNLYPLLVHVRLFGGGYLAQVEQVLRRYGDL